MRSHLAMRCAYLKRVSAPSIRKHTMKTFTEVAQSACELLAGTGQQPLTPREASILAMLKPFASPQESNCSGDPGCTGCNHIPCICTTSVNARNTGLLGDLQRRLAEFRERQVSVRIPEEDLMPEDPAAAIDWLIKVCPEWT